MNVQYFTNLKELREKLIAVVERNRKELFPEESVKKTTLLPVR